MESHSSLSSSSSSSPPSSLSSESCCVKVAVNVRPLIGDEVTQGCRECVSVSPVTPQVQMGTHPFTFDHVYGSNGSPSSLMFEECVAPLVDGLFHGYNATVLAYGQTGSGKTYTMGTGIKDGTKNGLIPQVMSALFNKIDSVKHQMGFQLHVSFIEILKEEVLDLLDSSVPFNRLANGTPGKVVLSKSPVQIRESPNGVITLSGATEVPIATKEEMASCLEQGSLTRATGSTNMNNESSRSHAIFTITLEQMRKISSISVVKDTVDEDMGEEYCCAKLHLVDLAGSERAKRTGSGGVRLKEGIHINRGLLALGNVISALGDEKRRKEGAHVPYRDSKLTRLLQDSLGGNSKTVMIACISPADINAEETLNTLKYANRARNIQNKPVANKDLICSEMQKMRQELQYLQATLCARGATSSEEVQVMREKIMKLESTLLTKAIVPILISLASERERDRNPERKERMEIEKSNNGGSNPSAGEEFKDMIKGVTKFLMMVIFLGTIMLWIMMPTLTYRTKWLPHLRIKFGTSTYFGATGTTLFMYMFPMMVVACLGCVYLHFKNRKSPHHIDRETKGGVWSKLRKPMLVKGPLGIVSVTEITFLAMFVALLLWCFITYLRNSFATITPKSAAAHDESLWQAKLESAALRLGLIGNICLAFLFLPVARGSSLLPAMGLTSESSIKYHIWLGHMVMALFTVHGLCYIIYWASMHEISQMIMWDTKGVSNLAGEIALAAGLVMWATTYPKIRRRFFEVFFYTHYLYIVFMLFFVLHVGISFSFIALPGFYIFLVDRFLRFLQSRENVRLLAARILPSDTMELTFSKNSKLVYSPTSIMFVNIPSISKLQWHPFTITSSSKLEPEKLSIVIKKEGKWSTKLHQRLSSSDQIDRLAVSVEGPYGPASADFLRHEALVMVCGGSGITPFISVIRDLIATSQKETCKIPKITLICAFKKSSEISMLDLVLPLSGLETELSSDINIKIEAFITRDNDAGDEAKAGKIKTLWFKPSLSDQSISSILGPNSWLWLGAILASSFLIFMIIIGIITRYYIYPIDHNTNKIYSLTSKTIIYILVISVSIMATCSAAMLWNKKKYGKVESKQVQNVDRPSPTSSPTSSWGYNSLREIESTPQESLVQRTNLHFGERPNLKKLLLDVEGSSVGVLVCGPKKMRQKVAEICSSGLAENLHFESISFSW